MKAVTIWQPYATLLIEDIKKFETRSWKTSHRGFIAIHAAKKPIKDVAKLLPEDIKKTINEICKKYQQKHGKIEFPAGAIIGTAELIYCHLIDEAFLRTLTEEEKAMGDFTPGRYAWEFKDKSTDLFVPEIIGGQGLWNWQKENLSE